MGDQRILTLHDWIHEELQAQADELLARIGAAVRPLFFYDERRRPKVEGTGILFRIRDRRFLLTAAHVLECPFPLYIGGSDHMYGLEGPRTTTLVPPGATRLQDQFDLAWIELSPEYEQVLGAVAWLTEGDLCPGLAPKVEGVGRTRFLLVGFPSTQLKWRPPHHLIDPKRLVLEAQSVTFEEYPKHNRTVSTHLVLDYSRREALTANGQHTLPKPKGLSGCAIFRLPEIRPLIGGSIGLPQLAAVTTDWPETNRRILLATRVNVVLQGLARHLLQVNPG